MEVTPNEFSYIMTAEMEQFRQLYSEKKLMDIGEWFSMFTLYLNHSSAIAQDRLPAGLPAAVAEAIRERN